MKRTIPHPESSAGSLRALLPCMASMAFLVLLLISQSGCGILIGNVKPVDEKSTAYGVSDLSLEKPDWKKLDQGPGGKADIAESKEAAEGPSEVSDVAYQSKATSSIITLNSACRHSAESQHRDLRSLTDMLFLGMTDISFKEERGLEIQEQPALQTTIRGKLNGEDMMLRTVVLKRGPCIYDLIYLARPRHFPQQEADFSHFVASLRLR